MVYKNYKINLPNYFLKYIFMYNTTEAYDLHNKKFKEHDHIKNF